MALEDMRWLEWPTSDRLTAKGQRVCWLALTPKGDLGMVTIGPSGNLGQMVLPVPSDRHDHRARGWRFLRVDLEVLRGRGLAIDLAAVALEAERRIRLAAEQRIADLEQELAGLRRQHGKGSPHAQ